MAESKYNRYMNRDDVIRSSKDLNEWYRQGINMLVEGINTEIATSGEIMQDYGVILHGLNRTGARIAEKVGVPGISKPLELDDLLFEAEFARRTQ